MHILSLTLRALQQQRCNSLLNSKWRPTLIQSLHRRMSDQATRAPFADLNPLSQQAQEIMESIEKETSPSPSKISELADLAKQASDQGSPRGMTILASMYREGFGVGENIQLARDLFQKAAEEGDPIAQCSLGCLILDELEKPNSSSVTGSNTVLEVDDEGIQRASVSLEVDNGQGSMETQTPAELVRKVRKARKKAGFTDAEAREFEEFKKMKAEEEKNERMNEATKWLELAAEQGNDIAMVTLANQLVHNKPSRAVDWYTRAAKEKRNTDAYFNLGQIYTEGLKGVPIDEKLAGLNFSMAAQLGDSSAQFYLGHLYRTGSEYVKVDHASARQYIEMAAEQSHPGATYYLALMHRNGEGGLDKNPAAFLKHLRRAAELEYGRAHFLLGDLYYKGEENVEMDHAKALEHFAIAGKLGESEGYCSAAAMVFHGHGTESNHMEAFLLYQEAAQLGSITALRNIASMYFKGHGVPRNESVAERFFKAADEMEQEQIEEDKAFMKTPIKETEAPRHPMMDIPRNMGGDADEDVPDSFETLPKGN